MDRDDERIAPTGRSLLFTHGARTRRAVVLLHGMSATPAQFVDVARALYGRGYNVFVPRLPRHGHRERLSDALAHMTGTQLKAAARDAFAAGRELGDEVVVAGFSLGGLLAVYLGQTQPADRVVAVAPFLGIALVPDALRSPLARLALRLPNRMAWWDPLRKAKVYPEHGYPRYATHAVAHALNLAQEVLDNAKSRAPSAKELVLVSNAREAAVNNRVIARLATYWKSHDPKRVHVHSLESLPLSHDVIEPLREGGLAQRVLPRLLELIDE
jgi:pimeloyl-ACP methyl ester carboxylesterase